jgi:hypothetical protein
MDLDNFPFKGFNTGKQFYYMATEFSLMSDNGYIETFTCSDANVIKELLDNTPGAEVYQLL